MKVPLTWLSDFIELKKSPEEIGEILTLSGHEVEEIYDPYQKLGELITVKILEIIQLEDLKDLVLCKVTDGKAIYSVLTGAKDKVKPNLIVGLAKANSYTFDYKKIEKKEVKGFVSEGKFLSPFEAGVSEERQDLLIFPEGIPLGISIYEILKISEPVLDIAITPNRGDLLSILGIARELNLLCDWEINYPQWKEELKKGSSFLGKISILDSEGCFRYMGRLFSGIEVKESPFWLQKRLFLCGLRPINNIVDITNYVLLELGQPLHAFDWSKIEGKEIIVRRAKPGESLLMLDGVIREFSEEDLVIADKKKALVLAGIMGGEESGVKEGTQEVFLESAWFNPRKIRLSGQRHRLTTESSYRFERKVDPEGILAGLLRATELILQTVKPSDISEIIDAYPSPITSPKIKINPQKIFKILGFEMERSFIEKTFKKLGKLEKTRYSLVVEPFSYRQDLTIPEDLIEELARLYGYDQIPTIYPLGKLKPPSEDSSFKLVKKIRDLLKGFGLNEVITYSFINPEILKKLFLPSDYRLNYLELSNPISLALSVMRTTLLPGLLEVAKVNSHREVENLSLFEIGKIFLPPLEGSQDLAEERLSLGILLKGCKRVPPYEGYQKPFDIFDLKGILEELFSALNLKVVLQPYSSEPFLKKGLSYDLILEDKKIGWFGAFKNYYLEELDLKGFLFVAEIDLEPLIAASKSSQTWKEIKKPPKFPATFRDISALIDRTISIERILEFFRNLDWAYLEKIELIDVYIGPSIPTDKKSLTLRFWYRAKDRTLLDEEINLLQEELAKRFFDYFKAIPR